jgi:hypothetical protein
MTRAKFVLVSKTEQIGYHYENGKSTPEIHVTCNFQVVSSGSDENKSFFASTPSGEIKLNLARKEVADQFQLQKEYYVDFSPAN